MAPPLAGIEGKYEIVAKLGEGGMGAIYKVRHRLLDEVRVVKMLRPQHEGDEELRARFAREARSAIRLRHPNVVQIFDFGVEESGAGLIVMEHIAGVDLQRLIQNDTRPSLPLALEIARQSLRALGFLHRNGFVHRDVSPDNLMLTLDFDGDPLIKLIDLGIAKRIDSKQQLTVSGSFLGKFRYASPEHFGSEGADGVDARSDLYTFALVLYELLTGHYPVSAESTSQLIAAHLFQDPKDFAETDPDGVLPESVRAMLLHALDKKPDGRFQSAREWIAEIRELQRELPLGDAEREEAEGLVGPTESPGGASGSHDAVPRSGGSTQHRLDRSFGIDSTPRPDRVSVAAGNDSDSDPMGALVAGAEALFQLGQLGQAQQQIETVLSFDPENAAARRLMRRIEDGPPTVPMALDETIDHGFAVDPMDSSPSGSIDASALTAERAPADREPADREPKAGAEGATAAETALGRTGETADETDETAPDWAGAASLEDAAADADILEARIDELLAGADRCVLSADYPLALDRLRQAQSLAPSSGPLYDRVAEGIMQFHRTVRERERERAIGHLERHVLELLEDERLAEAAEEIVKGRGIHGGHRTFDSLEQLVAKAYEERQRALVNEAGLALQAGRFPTAVRFLEQVLEIDPKNEWVIEKLDQTRERAEDAKAQAESLAEIDALLDDDDLPAAERALRQAREVWGADVTTAIRGRFQEARRRAARELLSQAEDAQLQDDLIKARLLAAHARELSPNDEMVQHFALLLDGAADDDPKPHEGVPSDTQTLLHTVAEIERLRIEGEPLGAWRTVQQAIDRHGEIEALVDLRRQLAERILEEAET